MKLSDYKDRYKGHRAFFIGNGPSIKHTPLELLKDEYCFGTNRVIQLYEHTEWRPTHYIAVSGENCKRKDWFNDMVKIIETGIPCFLANWLWKTDANREKWYFPPTPDNVLKLFCMKLWDKDDNCVVGWSTNVESQVIQSRGVASGWMQLAYWMGFNPLYLVGCDLGYKPFDLGKDDPNHWLSNYDKERGEEDCIRENEVMHYAHHRLAQLAKEVGCEVYNATIGGELEAYPRVDLYELLDDNNVILR